VAPYPAAVKSAIAFRDLRDLVAELVHVHHLDSDFIRLEYATILNPSSAEEELCKRNVAAAMAKENRRAIKRLNVRDVSLV